MLVKPSIFLDRDGTIIEDIGFIKKPSEVVFYPYTISSLLLLQEHFLLFIITNQSGIAKGFITQNEADLVNQHIVRVLKSQGVFITETFCCPHKTEDNCNCKKPKTQFIFDAKEKYAFDFESSYIIGDHPSDVECGINAGINSIYLLSGHGLKHRAEVLSNVLVFENLFESVKYILSTLK